METSSSTSKTCVIEISSDEENLTDIHASLVNSSNDEDGDIVLLSGNESSKCTEKIDCNKARSTDYPFLRSVLLGCFHTEKNVPGLTSSGSLSEDSQDAQAKTSAASHQSVSSMNISITSSVGENKLTSSVGENKLFASERQHTMFADTFKHGDISFKKAIVPDTLRSVHHPARTRSQDKKSFVNTLQSPTVAGDLKRYNTSLCISQDAKKTRREKLQERQNAEPSEKHKTSLFHHHPKTTAKTRNKRVRPTISDDVTSGDIHTAQPRQKRKVGNLNSKTERKPEKQGKTKRKKRQPDTNSADTTHLHGSLLPANFQRAEHVHAHGKATDCGHQNLLRAPPLSPDTTLSATSIVAELPQWWHGIDKDSDVSRQCDTDEVRDSASSSGTRGKGKKRNRKTASASSSGKCGKGKTRNRKTANDKTKVEIPVPANGTTNSDNLQSDKNVMRELYVCKWTDSQQTSLLGDKLQSSSLTCTGIFVNRAACSVESKVPEEENPSKSTIPEEHFSDEIPVNEIPPSAKYGAAKGSRIRACRVGDARKSGSMGNSQKSVAKDCQTYSRSRKIQKGDDNGLMPYSPSVSVNIIPFDQTHQYHLQENDKTLSTTLTAEPVLVEDMYHLPSEQAHNHITSDSSGRNVGNENDDPPLKPSKSAFEELEEDILFAEAFNLRPNTNSLEGPEISLPFGQEKFYYQPLLHVPVQQESISTIPVWSTLAELSLTHPASSSPVDASVLQNPENLTLIQFAAVSMSSAPIIPVEPRPRTVHSNMNPFPAPSNAHPVPETSNKYPSAAPTNAYALPVPGSMFQQDRRTPAISQCCGNRWSSPLQHTSEKVPPEVRSDSRPRNMQLETEKGTGTVVTMNCGIGNNNPSLSTGRLHDESDQQDLGVYHNLKPIESHPLLRPIKKTVERRKSNKNAFAPFSNIGTPQQLLGESQQNKRLRETLKTRGCNNSLCHCHKPVTMVDYIRSRECNNIAKKLFKHKATNANRDDLPQAQTARSCATKFENDGFQSSRRCQLKRLPKSLNTGGGCEKCSWNNCECENLFHYRRYHSTIEPIVTCDICCGQFEQGEAFARHAVLYHEGRILFRCFRCGMRELTGPGFVSHMLETHKVLFPQCRMCSVYCFDKTCLAVHKTSGCWKSKRTVHDICHQSPMPWPRTYTTESGDCAGAIPVSANPANSAMWSVNAIPGDANLSSERSWVSSNLENAMLSASAYPGRTMRFLIAKPRRRIGTKLFSAARLVNAIMSLSTKPVAKATTTPNYYANPENARLSARNLLPSTAMPSTSTNSASDAPCFSATIAKGMLSANINPVSGMTANTNPASGMTANSNPASGMTANTNPACGMTANTNPANATLSAGTRPASVLSSASNKSANATLLATSNAHSYFTFSSTSPCSAVSSARIKAANDMSATTSANTMFPAGTNPESARLSARNIPPSFTIFAHTNPQSATPCFRTTPANAPLYEGTKPVVVVVSSVNANAANVLWSAGTNPAMARLPENVSPAHDRLPVNTISSNVMLPTGTKPAGVVSPACSSPANATMNPTNIKASDCTCPAKAMVVSTNPANTTTSSGKSCNLCQQIETVPGDGLASMTLTSCAAANSKVYNYDVPIIQQTYREKSSVDKSTNADRRRTSGRVSLAKRDVLYKEIKRRTKTDKSTSSQLKEHETENTGEIQKKFESVRRKGKAPRGCKSMKSATKQNTKFPQLSASMVRPVPVSPASATTETSSETDLFSKSDSANTTTHPVSVSSPLRISRKLVDANALAVPMLLYRNVAYARGSSDTSNSADKDASGSSCRELQAMQVCIGSPVGNFQPLLLP